MLHSGSAVTGSNPGTAFDEGLSTASTLLFVLGLGGVMSDQVNFLPTDTGWK